MMVNAQADAHGNGVEAQKPRGFAVEAITYPQQDGKLRLKQSAMPDISTGHHQSTPLARAIPMTTLPILRRLVAVRLQSIVIKI